MTAWMVATATAAALGVAGAGTLVTGTRAQSSVWNGNEDLDRSLAKAQRVVRVLGGSGSKIGVAIRDFNDDELKGGKGSVGVVVEEVEAESPAATAGFKVADIVVEFDGERVRSTRQFTRLVQETAVGRSVAVAVMRDGQRVTLNVQPRSGGASRFWDGSADDVFAVPVPKMPPPPPPPPALKRDMLPPSFEYFLGASGQLGISVDELSPQLSEYFGTKEGVLVTTVRDNSNASKAGVKAGDVITSLNGGTVTTAADLWRRAQRLEGGDEFTLSIVRDKKPMTLKGKVEASQERRSTGRTIV